MKLKRTSGIILPKTHTLFNNIIRDLDRTLVGFNNEVIKVKFYKKIDDDKILIPRFYKLIDENYIDDITSDGEDIEIRSNIIPRNERQKKVIDYLLNHKSGVIKLEPGSGKTVMSIAAISELKKKAIIFVHKNSLRNQWAEQIIEFTNLEEDDIGFLSTKTYEEDFKKRIVIATVQAFCALLKNEKIALEDELKKANFGVAFFDETHTTVGPEQFSKASLTLPCKRVFGLSATPTRADGCDDIIFDHLGEIFYVPPEKDELLKPKVFMVQFPFKIYSAHKKYCNWGGRFNPGKYYQQMYKSSHYNSTIAKMTLKLYNQDRNILILGVRKKALLELAKSLNLPKTEIGIFIPGTNSKERLSVSDTDDLQIAFNEKRIVFSTYNACRDGNNRKSLDTLIMSCPTGNIEQAIGRIQRTLKGKKIPF
ncbi:MAG: DEAD/DEAH box helicase, partial [bacterium]